MLVGIPMNEGTVIEDKEALTGDHAESQVIVTKEMIDPKILVMALGNTGEGHRLSGSANIQGHWFRAPID